MSPVDEIAALFESDGARDYLGEPVTVAAHLLQSGALAAAAGAPPALIAAALLHDTGHLHGTAHLHDTGHPHDTGHLHDTGHGERGARWLAAWFPPAVTEPVRLHVAAKRYLCAVEPGYLALLSEESVRTLSAQGGPMTAAQARSFAAHPYAAGAIRVRRWDDQAKDPAAVSPEFARFRPVLDRLLRLPAAGEQNGEGGNKTGCIVSCCKQLTLPRGGLPLPELSRERRHLVLAICCLSLFIVGMDSTIVNVALPSIGRDFRAPVSGLQWTIDAYLLVIASFLMLSGSVADRVGRRRVFQIGLAVFTLGSLACSLAPSLGWLIAFRAFQAVGGSMLNPVAMSIITNVFTDAKERAQAIGIWGSVFGMSMALGPVIGGVLIQSVGWRGVFWVNIPVGVAAIILTALFVPESKAARARKLDPLGQALVIIFLGTLSYGIIEGPAYGWGAARILGCFALAAVALAAFLFCEPRRAQPLVDLRFFRSLPFSGAAVTAITAMLAMGGFLFLMTLYLQEVRGYGALIAGLFLLPMAVAMAASAPMSGRMIGARGPRIPLVISGVGLIAGGLLLTRLTNASPVWYVLVCDLVIGIAIGWVNAPITNSAVSGMPRSQAGVASGIASTSRQIGTSLGVAIMGSVLADNLHGPMKSGFAAATVAGWWIVAVTGVAVLALALWTTGKAGRASAERAALLIVAAEEEKVPARA